jgi:hypothetical protein
MGELARLTDRPPDATPPPTREGGGRANSTGGAVKTELYPMSGDCQTCSRCHSTGVRVTPTYYGPPLCRACGDADVEAFELEGWPRGWWEIPTIPHIGVWGAGGLVTHDWIVHRDFASVGALGEEAERKGLTQIWVHESALEQLRRRRGWLEGSPFTTSARSGGPVLSGYSKWWRPGGFGFTLHIPALERDSAFAGAEDAYRLMCDVAWYEHATGGRAPWRGGGTITSDAWLRDTYSSRRRVDLTVTEHPLPVLTGKAREARWFWSRPPIGPERNMRYCHALDLNLAYAAVAGSLALPAGEVVHTELPTFDKRVPGIWLIEPPEWTDPYLPAPWADDHRRATPGPHWVTTPTMERCDQLGLWPIESYTWPTHHAYLRPWYELVKHARDELLPIGGVPMDALKQLSRRGVGRLASRTRSKVPEADALYQPYWTWAIIAETRARLHRRMAALAELRGPRVAPVAIDTDCVYFLSSRPSAEVLAIRLGLPFGSGLGQFKVAGSCSGADAREVLEGPGSVAALRALVKA